MTSKKEAQKQAQKFRRENPKDAKQKTVNVVKMGKGNNYGIRFSPKGTRSTFDWKTQKEKNPNLWDKKKK